VRLSAVAFDGYKQAPHRWSLNILTRKVCTGIFKANERGEISYRPRYV